MQEPDITNHPTEIFGYPFTDHSPKARTAQEQQFCPFLRDTCKKPRKSEPHIKVGICSAGFKGSFLEQTKPVILCPHRFDSPIVFETLRQNYFSDWDTVEWTREVSMGVGGSIDFVAVRFHNGNVEDFLCVEFQAAGTTGTPWQAVLEFKATRTFAYTSYPYGINWANEFMKTMMQQVYKKGKIIEYWKRKIVFVLQDVGLDYLRSACDTSALRPADDKDPVHFCTFRLLWNDGKWDLEFVEKVSTDIDGINRILGGSSAEQYPSTEDFKHNILRKLER